jgi:hypothetical protein
MPYLNGSTSCRQPINQIDSVDFRLGHRHAFPVSDSSEAWRLYGRMVSPKKHLEKTLLIPPCPFDAFEKRSPNGGILVLRSIKRIGMTSNFPTPLKSRAFRNVGYAIKRDRSQPHYSSKSLKCPAHDCNETSSAPIWRTPPKRNCDKSFRRVLISAPEAHRKRTRGAPEAHRKRTGSAPEAHRKRTRSAPEAHQRRTRSAPEAHRKRTDPLR